MFTGSAVYSAVIPPCREGLRVFHFRIPPMRLSFRIGKGLVLHVPVQDLEEHILIVCISTGCFDILGTDWIYWGSNAILKDRMSTHPAFSCPYHPRFLPFVPSPSSRSLFRSFGVSHFFSLMTAHRASYTGAHATCPVFLFPPLTVTYPLVNFTADPSWHSVHVSPAISDMAFTTRT